MKRQFLPGRIRTLLGIRKRRALLPRGPKPLPGARIFAGEVRMTVRPGMSDGLWNWLSKLGWREITFHPDRRRYDDISDAWTRTLYLAHPDDRSRVLMNATAAARRRTPHPEVYHDVLIRRQSHRLEPLVKPT